MIKRKAALKKRRFFIMLYRIVTYKTSEIWEGYDVWRNVYTFESVLSLVDMKLVAQKLMQGETNLHCTHVRFMFATINPIGDDNPLRYGDDGTESPLIGDAGIVALPSVGWEYGQLQGNDFCGPEMVLVFNRNVAIGRRGKLWYRGALRERDLYKEETGYVALKTANDFTRAFQDTIVYSLGNDVSKFKVEQLHGASTGGKEFIAVSDFTCDTILRDRTRRRARRRVPDHRRGTLIALWQFIDVARREYDAFVFDMSEQDPFYGEVTRDHLIHCLEACQAVSTIVQNAVHTTQSGETSDDLSLYTRFGPTCDELFQAASVTTQWSDQSAKPSEGFINGMIEITSAQRETFLIADYYFTRAQLEGWKDIADKFFKASQMLLRGDYLVSDPPPN